MKLYDVSKKIIEELLKDANRDGKQEIIRKIPDHKYPIKIVFDIQKNINIVITVYPLKRGLR